MKTPAQILDQYPKARNAWEKWSYGKTHEMISSFVEQHIELSWGVFLRFFGERGVKISLEYKPRSETWSIGGWIGPRMFFSKGMFDTPESAQLAALEAALTILEGRL